MTMLRSLGWRRGLFIAVVALQVLVILGFTGIREMSLRLGREVILATVPVDPRDLFRGDYVVLRYEISNVEGCSLLPGETAYVPLVRGADDVHHASRSAWRSAEDARERGEGGLFIRGRVERSGQIRTGVYGCEIAYGIESYFVPEGTGREIERLRGRLNVRVSVDGDGDAVIVDLIIPEDAASPRNGSGVVVTPAPVIVKTSPTPTQTPASR